MESNTHKLLNPKETCIFNFQYAKSSEGNTYKLLNPEETCMSIFKHAKSSEGNAHELLNLEEIHILQMYSMVIWEYGSMSTL